jgi:histidinol-phosphate aminotransferase
MESTLKQLESKDEQTITPTIKRLVEHVIRPEIRALSAYHVPDASGFVKLEAMENPFPLPVELKQALAAHLTQVALNRYPVPSYTSLKSKIQQHFGVPDGFPIVLGNGSDELIAMLSTACAQPGAVVLAPIPTFVMYAMSAQFAGLRFVGVPLRADFSLDLAAMLAAIAEHKPAITYLSYPNNPTGTLFQVVEIEAILNAVGDTGLVVVDEAYEAFAGVSFMPRLAEFDNLLVMRTVSKLGLAGIRLGYMSGNPALLQEIEKVRPPYNINVLTEAAADFMLDHVDVLLQQAAQLREQRAILMTALQALKNVEVFPSAANFLLIRLADGDAVHRKLLEQKILVKNVGKMHPSLRNCLRITVSTAEENRLFLDALSAALTAL